jgi:SpoVK/Ycf46/Vps4 family AAA+-type ATPase
LQALAEIVRDEVSDSALVVTGTLKQELEDLVLRCRLRDGLVEGFGPALRARYRPGVRALLVGPSGTGKTLAASWIATRLGLPLFRVELSAVTSKYIGETEKNLSELLSRAEENDVVLLFDEADSLFGKRTEVRDAHDRFANAQTNFLLQRLDNYDGIVLLTSNSRARFDAAFARRLDLILEFPLPGPEERRALWLAHLGGSHRLTPAEINRIAVAAELSGGQIRSAVLSAAIHAAKHGGAIRLPDLAASLLQEYRKLGRQLPEDLQVTAAAAVA